MNVGELIKRLQTMPQDLEVYSCCDHGQAPEKSCSPTVAYTDKIEHTLWDDWSADLEGAEELGYDKQFVLL